ncbi:glycosyltransferase [Tamlana haliotis]|uniref:Glycosyltransferase n=1 Tax=Pseudotamlana haliotis TaxID=2614804 RepID=A0A6N6MLT0_9FLAO|nr:glycosyltransferase [Tamlana haliotis]KAB1071274.1 glycosyltransferase [Tamlana haliotis]
MINSKKNILLIMPYGSVGGMERLALTFYDYYKEKGHQIKVLKLIQLQNDIINFGEDELYLSTVDFSEMKASKRLLFYAKSPIHIRKIIKKYNITHSIAFGDMANLFSSLTQTKEFKIGSIHALKSVELITNTFFNKLTRFGYKHLYGKLNKLVCISKAIKEDLIANCAYKFSNLEVIYNPHNTSEIVKRSQETIKDPLEKELFLKKTILFLGRLSVQKSPWHLLNAFAEVISTDKKINLILVGDGDYAVQQIVYSRIKDLNLSNNVHLLGRKSNPYKYIHASNVLVLSSLYEGTPNVIVESIAVGTPVVSSFCTKGIIELMSTKDYNETDSNIEVEAGIVTPNFFNGEIGIPKSFSLIYEEKLLAKALLKVINNSEEYKEKLHLNKQELLKKFNLEYVAKQYLKPVN